MKKWMPIMDGINNGEPLKMKIYEVRDCSSDESYYTRMFCATEDEAIAVLKGLGKDVAEFQDDGVIGAVFEHELGVMNSDPLFEVKVLEMVFHEQYSEETDDYTWVSSTTYERKEGICPRCKGEIKIRNPKGWCDHLHYPENICKGADINEKA